MAADDGEAGRARRSLDNLKRDMGLLCPLDQAASLAAIGIDLFKLLICRLDGLDVGSAAEGEASRLSRSRSAMTRVWCMRAHTPSRCRRRKWQEAVCQGGKSCGSRRQTQPARST